ncbi:MAG: SDR family NAD(P)-dependent oxidoreductase [Bacteroidales bacterium]
MMPSAFSRFSLTNKTILITGASSGIGRQCAVTCNSLGAYVIVTGRDMERLKETLSLLEFPEKAFMHAVDLTNNEKVMEFLELLKYNHFRLNGIIHSAGISTTLPFKMISPEKMETFFRTNVFAAINLTRIGLRNSLISENAGIVFISSVMGFLGENAKVLYGMTKGALLAAVKSLSIELASSHIRVNAISPGVVETPMSKNAVYSRNEESFQRIKNLHPLGLGRPEDVANACAFLVSDASRWITGINLIVDGGYSSR